MTVTTWARRRRMADARLHRARQEGDPYLIAAADHALRLTCTVEAARMGVHAAGARVGAAELRAGLATDERERLAWEAQAHLAAEDVQRHGKRMIAAALELRKLGHFA